MAGAFFVAVTLLAVIIHRLTSRPDHSTHMVEEIKPAALESAAPTAAVHVISDAEWMQKIRDTPALGRAGLMREILSIADEDLRNKIATALAVAWLSSDVEGYLAFLDSMRVVEGLTSESMHRFSAALISSFETVAGKRPTEGKIRYLRIDHGLLDRD